VKKKANRLSGKAIAKKNLEDTYSSASSVTPLFKIPVDRYECTDEANILADAFRRQTRLSSQT
jgi:hypothetical protein